MKMPSRRLRASVAALSTLAALTACASEKKPEAAPPATPTVVATPTTPPPTTPEQVAAFCSSLVALDTAVLSLGPPPDDESPSAAPSGEPTDASGAGTSSTGASAAPSDMPSDMPSAMATGEPAAPPAGGPPGFPDVATAMAPVAELMDRTKTTEVTPQADVMIALLRDAVATNDRKKLESDAYGMADGPLDAYGLANCGYNHVAASAVDYEYDGVPKTIRTGQTAITLRNDGKEFHEIVLLRVNDGVTDSVDDILKLPPPEMFAKVTPAFFTMAAPGLSGTGFTNLAAGHYAWLCFIPKGSKPGAEPPPDAPPHFTKGMLEEVDVTADAPLATAAPSTASPTPSSDSMGSMDHSMMYSATPSASS